MTDLPKTTWLKLAKELGYTRQAFTTWRKLPGAPTEPNADEWQTFIDANDLGNAGNRVGAGREELLKEKLRTEIRLGNIKIGKEERKLIDRSEVDALHLHIGTRQRSVLYEYLETEAPPKLDGLPAAQMRPILRKMADDICDIMAGLVDEFNAR
jgi:hypothetical protein